MLNMENICRQLSSKIGEEINLDEEQRQVVEYGLFALIQIILSVLFVLVFGLVFGVVIEAMIILLVSSGLRKYSGGVHASTPSLCLIFGTIVCVCLSKLSINFAVKIDSINIMFIIGLIIFIWTYIMIYIRVPVDSSKKRITNVNRRRYLKQKSYILVTIYLAIIVGMILCNNVYLYNYIYCIYLGVCWQIFTVSKLGVKIINRLDSIIYLFLYNKRRVNNEKN